MKNVKLTLLSCALLSLTACSQLKDVEHSWCPPVQTEEVNLSADALFRFDKSDVKDLLPKGKVELDQLADKLTSGYAKVENIHLVGHTDRLGSEKYNYELGLKRANTVKQYLADKQIAVPMSVESAGETMPLTKDCVGEKATKALTACLQPDRRVAVKIHGIKKQ
ncbi:OmpA family protein [Pasteurellaceae bacterium 22721_9_1]